MFLLARGKRSMRVELKSGVQAVSEINGKLSVRTVDRIWEQSSCIFDLLQG